MAAKFRSKPDLRLRLQGTNEMASCGDGCTFAAKI